jgi:hypothetical protein
MDYVCFYHFINCKYNTNIFAHSKIHHGKSSHKVHIYYCF